MCVYMCHTHTFTYMRMHMRMHMHMHMHMHMLRNTRAHVYTHAQAGTYPKGVLLCGMSDTHTGTVKG